MASNANDRSREPIRLIDGTSEAIRSRPGIYLGQLGPTAIERLIQELVNDAIDGFNSGELTEIGVRIGGEQITVCDNGIGVQFCDIAVNQRDNPTSSGLMNPAVRQLASAMRQTRLIRPQPRLGIRVAIAVSSSLRCQVWRDGELWQQEYRNGHPVNSPHLITGGQGRGTIVTLIPDAEILKARAPRLPAVRAQLFETSHMFPGLTLGFQEEKFHAPNGLEDLAFIQYPGSIIGSDPAADRPMFKSKVTLEQVEIDALAVGESRKRCIWHCWVNCHASLEHGSHQLGFSDALMEIGWEPVVALIHVKIAEPNYTEFPSIAIG